MQTNFSGIKIMSSAATKACVETRCPPNFPGGHSVQETRRGSHKCETPGGFRSGGGGI